MKKTTKTSPNQVDFSFEARPPEPRRDHGAEIVNLRRYAASQAHTKQVMLDRAIMARAAHLTSPRGLD